MNENQKIRKFETEILDEIYKTYDFYQYSEDIVIPYLLQVYSDTERHGNNLIKSGHNETNFFFYLNNMMHGIGHCIRWMVNQPDPKHKHIPNESIRQVHVMAADFLGWGTGYHMISQEFVTWSRGIKTAEFDEEKKTVTFLNPIGYDYPKVLEQQLLYNKRIQDVYSKYPHDEMEEEFTEWMKTIDLSTPPIYKHIDWKKGRSSNSYPLLYAKMSEILYPELNETTNFDGYTLKQLRQFYALFFLSFHFIRWVEAVLDSKSGENLSFGSNPFYLSSAQFIALSTVITGLSSITTASIIADLTFNHQNFHTSVSIQPFILSSSGTYYILPNLFSQLEPSRMVLGALNKGSKKKVYDKLINLIEKLNLDLLFNSINTITKWTSYLEKIIKLDGKEKHPDLIIIDVEQKCLCVIDYKHFIGPITASEVNYKMVELNKGIKQVESYIEICSKKKKIGLIDVDEFKMYGLIITHKPLPIPTPNNIDILISDMATFRAKINEAKENSAGLSDLIRGLKIQEEENSSKIFTPIKTEIKVGEWKVIRSQLKVE